MVSSVCSICRPECSNSLGYVDISPLCCICCTSLGSVWQDLVIELTTFRLILWYISGLSCCLSIFLLLSLRIFLHGVGSLIKSSSILARLLIVVSLPDSKSLKLLSGVS